MVTVSLSDEQRTFCPTNSQSPYPCRDTSHQISFNPFTPGSLVIGSGRSEHQGHFIEVGFWRQYHSNNGTYEMLAMARRYLVEGDERPTWSLRRLRSEMILGMPPLLEQEDSWIQVLDFVGYELKEGAVPWQHAAAFCSNRCDPRETIRNERGVLVKCSTPASLPTLVQMPLKVGKEPFQLELKWDDVYYLTFISNVPLEGKCWGCASSCMREDLAFTCDREQVLVVDRIIQVEESFLQAKFCSEGCVARAVPQIAKATADWKADESETLSGRQPRLLVSTGSEFYKYLAANEQLLHEIRTAGWLENHDGTFVL